MTTQTKTDDFEIEIKVDDVVVASLSSMNGMDGFITEPDIPFRRMSSSSLLDLAKFLIEAAKYRADEEISAAERG